MKDIKALAIARQLVLSISIVGVSALVSLAQISGANTFIVVSDGSFNAAQEATVGELAYPIIRDLWIVGGKEIPGVKGRMQTAVLASTPERHGSITDLEIAQSEVFELRSKMDPRDNKVLKSYAGYYAINVGEVIPEKQLLAMVDEVSYGEERPVVAWAGKPMPIAIDVPCCKPLDAEMLMKAFIEAGLVGDKGVFDEKGGLREGVLVMAFVPLPAVGKESMAPGFGERRKGGGGGTVFVLKSAP